MQIGTKIKELRIKNSLTQKDLADKLNVTFQAVSRWENNEAEPSFETVRQMTQIFGCTSDELLCLEKAEDPKSEEPKPIPAEPVVQPQKQLLAMCSQCGKAIYDQNDLHTVEVTESVRRGRHTYHEKVTKQFCKNCDEKRIQKEKAEKEAAYQEKMSGIMARRIHSFIWPTILLAICVALGVASFNSGDENSIWVGIVIGVVLYTLVGCFILDNNFVGEMWFGILSWGFVRLPGVIFSFDLDGLVFLIVVKIILFLLGIALAIGAGILATILAGICSLFVYPFALAKNLQNKE